MADDTRGARAVLAAGVAAQVSVATVGALSWGLLPVAVVGYLVGGEAARRAHDRRSELLRWVGTVLALLAVLVLAPAILGAGDREQVKHDLGLLLMVAQVGQALGWRTRRDVRSGLLASAGLLVLAASYAPDALVGIPLLVGWVCVVAALALLGGSLRSEAARAAVVAVVLGLVAFLLVPAPASASARHRLGGLTFGSGTTRSAPGAFDGDQLDLNQRGSLPVDPIATVPQDSPALWRSTAYDVYDGASWRRSPNRRQVLTAGPAYPIAVAAGPVRTDVVKLARLSSADGGTVWSPGPIVSVTGPPGLTPIVDDSGGVVLQGSYASYTVTSQQPETNPVRLTSRAGADDPSPRWRSLPTALPARVGLLARTITAGTITRYDAALAISSYLRSHATYRLDSPVPGPGEDAVDRFLFVDRTGFCEQFASAEVVLLRSLGIPARLVTGLAYGVPAGDGRLFRVADRHAWVEVLVPGVGWVSDDPTAGVPLATNRAAVGLRQRLANSLASALRSLTRLPGGRPMLALALVVLTLLGGLVVGRRPRRQLVPSKGGPKTRAAPGPALSAFLRFDQRLGTTRRRQHESLRDLAGRLDAALTPALAVVERECYGPGAPSAGQVQSAVALLDGS